jgi:hypothetical protein
LFRVENRIVAFAARAYLSEAFEKRLQERNLVDRIRHLIPGQPRPSGGNLPSRPDSNVRFYPLALVDFEKAIFAGKTFKIRRTQPGGRRIVKERPRQRRSRRLPWCSAADVAIVQLRTNKDYES